MTDLLDRYVYAVTRLLPQGQRTEIEKELRSDLQDMVETEHGSEEERVRKVLESLGRPEQVAMNYSDAKPYLIGPKWFAAYVDTLKKISLVAGVVMLGIFTAMHAMTHEPVVGRIITILVSTIGALIQTVFWVTLVFVFFEHSRSVAPDKDKRVLKWSVDDLPRLPAKHSSK